MVEIGLIGLGIIAETHLAVLAARSDVTIAFVVDTDPGATATFDGEAPPRYTTTTAALQAHDADVVVIASSTPTHVELACEVLTRSDARVLVEKPLVHDLASLARIRELDAAVDLRSRLFVAHHFAFSPEVRWAAEQIAQNPRWGQPTRITAAFHDPYLRRPRQALASYVSSWMDSGANQLSLLSRFVAFEALETAQVTDGGTRSWCTARFRSGVTTGTARLFTSWQTGANSKRSTIELGDSGVEIWLDHTGMTAFTARGVELIAALGNDGHTPRRIAHYGPLYDSLLSPTPDPILGFDTAATVVELLCAAQLWGGMAR